MSSQKNAQLSAVPGPMDECEAQVVHTRRRQSPGHPQVTCWCCCVLCEHDPAMDYRTVMDETRRRHGQSGGRAPRR